MHFTNTDVEAAFRVLVKSLPESKRVDLELTCYSPDGHRRYRIEKRGQTPFGSAYWLSSKEAYYGIWTIISAINYLEKPELVTT